MPAIPYKRMSAQAVQSYDSQVLQGEHWGCGAEDEDTCKLATMLDCVEQAVLDYAIRACKGSYKRVNARRHEFAGLVRPVFDEACKDTGLDSGQYREGALGPSTDFLVQWADDEEYRAKVIQLEEFVARK